MGTPEVDRHLADLETGRFAYDGYAEVSEDPKPEDVLTEDFEQKVREMVADKSSYNGDYATTVLGAFDEFARDLTALPGFDEDTAYAHAELVWQRLNVFRSTAELVAAADVDEAALVRRVL